MSDKDTCSYCGEQYNPEHKGHYDDNTDINFCCCECEVNYDREIGLPDDYDRYDDHPPYCLPKCGECKSKDRPPGCHTFEPIIKD